MDLHKLFTDVFHPEPDETVAVIADVPHGELLDHQAWQERRDMAAEWRAAWVSLGERVGFDVLPSNRLSRNRCTQWQFAPRQRRTHPLARRPVAERQW